MNTRPRFATTALALAACLLLSACSDPRSTRLPLNLADIPQIQPQLDKLPAEERELVLAYLERSKGDVLPPKFADPDAPLTARTFREAIKLQRDWKVKFAAQQEQADVRREAREANFEPLRKTLSVTLLKREIVTADEAIGRQPTPGVALNTREVMVVTYRLQNHVADTITAATGSISVRTEADPDSLLGAASCWIDRKEPIPGSQSVEVRCADMRRSVGPQTRDFVEMDEGKLILTWEPKMIELSSGKVLRSE